MRDNKNDPTPWAVYCKPIFKEDSSCGLQFLSKGDYEYQMARPNQGWICPKCQGYAMWDDECQETNPPEEQEAS